MKSTKTVFIIALTLAALTAGAWAEDPGVRCSGCQRSRSSTCAVGSYGCRCPGVERCPGRATATDPAAYRATGAPAGLAVAAIRCDTCSQGRRSSTSSRSAATGGKLIPALQFSRMPHQSPSRTRKRPRTSARSGSLLCRSISRASPSRRAASPPPNLCGVRASWERTLSLLSIPSPCPALRRALCRSSSAPAASPGLPSLSGAR